MNNHFNRAALVLVSLVAVLSTGCASYKLSVKTYDGEGALPRPTQGTIELQEDKGPEGVLLQKDKVDVAADADYEYVGRAEVTSAVSPSPGLGYGGACGGTCAAVACGWFCAPVGVVGSLSGCGYGIYYAFNHLFGGRDPADPQDAKEIRELLRQEARKRGADTVAYVKVGEQPGDLLGRGLLLRKVASAAEAEAAAEPPAYDATAETPEALWEKLTAAAVGEASDPAHALALMTAASRVPYLRAKLDAAKAAAEGDEKKAAELTSLLADQNISLDAAEGEDAAKVAERIGQELGAVEDKGAFLTALVLLLPVPAAPTADATTLADLNVDGASATATGVWPIGSDTKPGPIALTQEDGQWRLDVVATAAARAAAAEAEAAAAKKVPKKKGKKKRTKRKKKK